MTVCYLTMPVSKLEVKPNSSKQVPCTRYLLLLALAAESFNFVYLLIQEASPRFIPGGCCGF